MSVFIKINMIFFKETVNDITVKIMFIFINTETTDITLVVFIGFNKSKHH